MVLRRPGRTLTAQDNRMVHRIIYLSLGLCLFFFPSSTGIKCTGLIAAVSGYEAGERETALLKCGGSDGGFRGKTCAVCVCLRFVCAVCVRCVCGCLMGKGNT